MKKNLPTSSTIFNATVSVKCYSKYKTFESAASESLVRVYRYGADKGGYYLLILPEGGPIPDVRTQVIVRATSTNG